MDTKVNVTKFAGKLRAHLKRLRSERVKALKKFGIEYVRWREQLLEWIELNAADRVEKISIKEIRENTDRWNKTLSFDKRAFFQGAPEPPVYPTDKPIREVQRLLRHIALTGQAIVTISTEDVGKWFGDEGDDA